MPLIPNLGHLVLYAACGIIASIASIFLGKFIVRWMNEFKDVQNTALITDARSETEKAEQTAAQESDALKKLDGR